MLSTVTSASLLAGLLDPHNQTVWQQYVDRYRPLLLRYAVGLGVPLADAEDVAQQTLLAFSQSYRDGKYERERGRLRSWLFGIASAQIAEFWRRRGRERRVAAGADAPALDRIADRDFLAELWDREWRDAVLAECLREVRREVEEQTFVAFDLFACQGLAAREVAGRLGISENAVYGAKRRVLDRLRELRPAIEDAY